jgi:hypothetical protein
MKNIKTGIDDEAPKASAMDLLCLRFCVVRGNYVTPVSMCNHRFILWKDSRRKCNIQDLHVLG